MNSNEKPTLEVVGAVIVKDNLILCAKRGYGALKDKWEFPGGKIEKGETPEEALKREIKEEMSIDIEVHQYISSTLVSYEDKNIHLSLYLCTMINENIHDVEHESIRWCTKEELSSLDWSEADRKMIKEIKIMGE